MRTNTENTGLTPEQQQLMQQLAKSCFSMVPYQELSATLNTALAQAMQTDVFDETTTRVNTQYVFQIINQALYCLHLGVHPDTIDGVIPNYKEAV